VHRYAVSGTVLNADVVISVPKLKVHKKVGVTLNVKGLVGINTNKNYLVHYRLGSPSRGGDQLPDHIPRGDRLLVRTQRMLYDRLLARRSPAADRVYHGLRWAYRSAVKPFLRFTPGTLQVDGGNWHGNDTAWRMALDLLRVFVFGGRDGRLHDTPQRRMFCVVDGIVGGQGDGPLRPDRAEAGCLVGGIHPLAVDLVAARLMGFDPGTIRTLAVGSSRGEEYGLPDPGAVRLRLSDGQVLEGEEWRSPEWASPIPAFRPHPGWTGRVELAAAAAG
jgi:hypothetical protein